MSIAANLMSQLDNAGILFNVRTESLVSESGLAIPNKKVIVNEASNQPMGVVSEGYKVVTNEQIFDGFTKSIEASGVNTDGLTVNVLQTPTGSRSMVNFMFPNEFVTVNGDESKTALQISALNSYDGTTRYISKAGGLRMKCMNGQILGSIVGAYAGTHSKNLDVDAGARQVMQMVQEFNSAKDYWGKMMARPVSDQEVKQVLIKFLEIRNKDDEALLKNSRFESALRLYATYSREMGKNAYALYNAMTDYISHKAPRSEQTALVNATDKMRNMAKLLDSEPVFDLV